MRILMTVLIAALTACVETEIETDPVEKKGIVDCNAESSKFGCKECGHATATITCCPAGWTCDVLCNNWVKVYGPKGEYLGRVCK